MQYTIYAIFHSITLLAFNEKIPFIRALQIFTVNLFTEVFSDVYGTNGSDAEN